MVPCSTAEALIDDRAVAMVPYSAAETLSDDRADAVVHLDCSSSMLCAGRKSIGNALRTSQFAVNKRKLSEQRKNCNHFAQLIHNYSSLNIKSIMKRLNLSKGELKAEIIVFQNLATTTSAHPTSTRSTTTTTFACPTNYSSLNAAYNTLLSSSPAATGAFDTNIVVNGDGETGVCETSFGSKSPLGWTTSGPITQVSYINPTYGNLSFSDPGPT
ncbi:unnamed protein product [Didymodactylos carnosus]|uniref:Uncharacterized protein n=1 Tax=Didymodactylos carnosus TaxID=1234261 RepID=A0A814WC97_9BILA|nr:unnamed protein product [Didymodactylos carnosus]CAF1214414.1 unnamed protein product [Didymodactylos carnosus]CAF3964045.1 unnamed protein product [Didymodactylos carnosus]CAF4023084.1 unnamed protein product [Didymodactylos carnosus]